MIISCKSENYSLYYRVLNHLKIGKIEILNMKTQSSDTSPEAEKFLISLIRKQSRTQRFRQVVTLSDTMIKLSKRAIARANKHLDEDGVKLLFIEYHYGKDLADRVRKYMEQRKHAKN